MDHSDFDALVRSFAKGSSSRRGALRVLAAGALGLLAWSEGGTSEARKTRNRCRKIEDKQKRKKCLKQAKARNQRHTAQSPTAPAPITPSPCFGGECSPVLLAAGDIASCSSPGDEATAALLDGLPATIAALGDIVYDSGTPEEFAPCYEPSWRRHKNRTRPAIGNHEYRTAAAAGYFGSFGNAAGDPSKGYYSYELGNWHIVVINSNCAEIGGCGVGS